MFYLLISELTDFDFKDKKNCKNYFPNFVDFFFRKLTEFQPIFFLNIKKLPKLFKKIFFFEKFFLRNFLSTNFFLVKIFIIEFFWRRFFFSHKYFCENFYHSIFANFFCIRCVHNNVFCEIFHSKFWLLRIFRFAILAYGKKIVNFFCGFFLAINVNTKFKKLSFLKKSEISSDRTFGFLYSLLGK